MEQNQQQLLRPTQKQCACVIILAIQVTMLVGILLYLQMMDMLEINEENYAFRIKIPR